MSDLAEVRDEVFPILCWTHLIGPSLFKIIISGGSARTKVGVRVTGSWITASAILVLVLTMFSKAT